MMDVKEDHPVPTGKFQAEVRLYLEAVGEQPAGPPPEGAEPPEEEGWPQLEAGEILLFLKYYDATTESLEFIGTHVALGTHTLADLLPALRAAKGLPATQPLDVYEEIEHENYVRFEQLSDQK